MSASITRRRRDGDWARHPDDGYDRHDESIGIIRTSALRLFAHLDDHARLSSHMSNSSWMMAGGRMDIDVDEGRGQHVGSRIRVSGSVCGMTLAVDETVIERNPPWRKMWETTGVPRLLVIGRYRMGFEITPMADAAQLRVFIDYSLPASPPSRWLGHLFAGSYAKWCTERMVNDAAKSFANP